MAVLGLGFPSSIRYWVLSINMAVLGFRFSKLSKILGTIYEHGCTGFLGFPSSIRYWVLSMNMAVLGFRFSKLSKILGTIYKHGCTGF